MHGLVLSLLLAGGLTPGGMSYDASSGGSFTGGTVANATTFSSTVALNGDVTLGSTNKLLWSTDVAITRSAAYTLKLTDGSTGVGAMLTGDQANGGGMLVGSFTAATGYGAIGSSGSNVVLRTPGSSAGFSLQDVNGNFGVEIWSGHDNHLSNSIIRFSNSTSNYNTYDTSLVRSAAGIVCAGTGSTTCNGRVQVGPAGSASLDFGATAAGTCDLLTVTVTGAADGDPVSCGIPTALAASDTYQSFNSYVSASNTVTVKRCNLLNAVTALSNPAAATVRCTVWVSSTSPATSAAREPRLLT